MATAGTAVTTAEQRMDAPMAKGKEGKEFARAASWTASSGAKAEAAAAHVTSPLIAATTATPQGTDAATGAPQ